MYDWVTPLYSRNWHNIVNQVYSNFKNVKKKFPFIAASKDKILKKKLNQGLKDLYIENYKILMNEIE